MGKTNLARGTGRRKTAVARVYLRDGNGTILINRIPEDEYFEQEGLRFIISQPLEVTDTRGKYDIFVRVAGGGKSGQAGAVKLGSSRALVAHARGN